MDDGRQTIWRTRQRRAGPQAGGMTNTATGGQPPPAILVRGLRKQYRGRPAVDGVDLEIRRGEVFALLGPNGAGKTTTIEILGGGRRRDAGEVSVLGADPAARTGPGARGSASCRRARARLAS
jgi:ABC-2 type transport system ATP-binding protein